ncbi:MAG: anhydro-N-acetylmuramic acid kinase [Armatimonadota bacterium]|nr:MAG: anhydro-N-acetylmuramic acid kinase [Armatimonadota bacterium]
MQAISQYADKANRRVVGVAASLTGIDAVLLDIAGAGAGTQISLLRFRRAGYSVQMREALMGATSPECLGIEICRLNFALGYLIADAAKQVTRAGGGSLHDVDLIGCGGLTLYHVTQPEDADQLSCPTSILQIGELAVVAEQTGATTIGEFGATDIAAGGCGAPLMPFVDFVLFHHDAKTRAVQSIERMANVTLVPAGDDPGAVVSFDTGPGHGVVDTITEIISEGKLLYDHDGRLASLGEVSRELLEYMMSHPFIRRSPPKTGTGLEFGSEFIGGVLDTAQRHDITVEDLLATTTAFTAESIAQSYRDFLAQEHRIDELILGGSGSYNATLRRMLQSRLPGLPIYLHEDFGIYSEAKAAIAYAILANETMLGRASNLPRATGASHPRPLGKIVPGHVGD